MIKKTNQQLQSLQKSFAFYLNKKNKFPLVKKVFQCFLVLFALSFLTTGCNKIPKIDLLNFARRTSFFKNINQNDFQKDSSIICLNYNIQVGFRNDQDAWDRTSIGGTEEHIAQLAEAILSIDADIVALQEVPYFRENNEVENFIKVLGEKTNMNYAFGSHGKNSPRLGKYEQAQGQWGNAILSKFPILKIVNREVDYISSNERRSVLQTDLQINDSKIISAYSLHYRGDAVRTQDYVDGLENTIALLNESDYTKILIGDFNYYSWKEVFDPLKVLVHNSLDVEPSFRDERDLIFIDNDDLVSKNAGKLDEKYKDLSDHEGIYSRINFQE